MNQKTGHLDVDTIISLAGNQMPYDKLKDIEEHLATCDKCFGIYRGLLSTGKVLARSFQEEKATSACPEEWEIGVLIKGELLPDISTRLSAHIKDCGYCTERAAVYYKALECEEKNVEIPSHWKQKAVSAIASEEIAAEKKVSLFQKVSSFFQNLSPVPAYAVAAAAIALLILTTVTKKEKIITLASSERITIRESEIPSAFGFMGSGETREVRYMEILQKDRAILFNWKSINGAEKYAFSLKDKAQGRVVYSQTTETDTKVSVKKDMLIKNNLYSWLITGKSTDGKYFEYTGEFMLVE
jgi:hypothetical protein